jgi:predicted nucleic acid-binding protein
MNHDRVFLDTNVVLRFLLDDHPDHSPRARALFASLARGEISLVLTETVVFETVFILEKQRKLERDSIVSALNELLEAQGIILLGPAEVGEAFDLYRKHPQLSIADCFHAANARAFGNATIVSFDREFDRVAGLRRIEPA